MSSTISKSAAQHTILVVDDENDILRVTENILTENGYDVVLCRGADTAINNYNRMARKPDLILTDVVMPGMSGPMLVDRLMATDPHLRVLFMSGYDERQIVQKYVVEKGFALLVKPFDNKRLTAAVKAALDGGASAKSDPAGAEA